MSLTSTIDRAVLSIGGPVMLSGSADPSAGAGVAAPLSSMYLRTGATAELWRKTGGANTAWTLIVFTSAAHAYFADGSDGALTAVGTVTLARDMFHTTVRVPNGTVIETNGFRLFATRSIIVEAGGVIRRNGANGVGAAAGASSPGGTLAATNAGGAGGAAAGSAGAAATDVPSQFNGAGGAGGAGSGGAGGAGGTVTIIAATDGNFRQVVTAVNALAVARAGSYMGGEAGSGGGGGGGSGAGQQGGGGGAGGGIVCIHAPFIENAGAIEAIGGNGGNAVGANAGGGGGGGGGIVYMVVNAFSGTAPNVSGGNPGTANGTGIVGTAGAVGAVIQVAA